MNIAPRYFTFAALLMVYGCAERQSAPLSPQAAGAAFSVRVSGRGNDPGWVKLLPPYTITHAVSFAGGIPSDDQDHTPVARVMRIDGTTVVVRRDLWTSFELHSGDTVNIPRRTFP